MSFGFGMGFPRSASAAGGPSLNLQFVGANSLSSQITFTRASTATYFNSAGVLTSAAIDAPRFDYNPSTLAAQGLLIEEQRTNSVANNTATGAVAGTPGTAPTGWTVGASANGVTRTIVGTGVENGITYIDVRYTTGGGTTSASGSFQILPLTTTAVAATSGQTWAASWYIKLQAGSFANLTLGANIAGRDSGGALLESTAISISPTSAALNTQRYTGSRTLNNASTAFVTTTLFQGSYASGVAIDVTIRIGLPQLEQGAFATSVIPTSGTALTRSADVASVNTLIPWFNATEGTTYWEGTSNSTTTGAFPYAYAFTDGTVNNRIAMTRNNASTQSRISVANGGVSQFAADFGTWTTGATIKTAIAYKASDFAGSNGGAAAVTSATGTIPTVTALSIGNINGTTVINGYLRRITYYPRRLSDAELQAITA